MVERVFEYDMITGGNKPLPCGCGFGIGEWLLEQVEVNKSYRVTVRVEPLPERVKWPWPSVSKVKVGRSIEGVREVIVDGFCLAHIGENMLGQWHINDARIASNDNGFVKLSEVPDAK